MYFKRLSVLVSGVYVCVCVCVCMCVCVCVCVCHTSTGYTKTPMKGNETYMVCGYVPKM